MLRIWINDSVSGYDSKPGSVCTFYSVSLLKSDQIPPLLKQTLKSLSVLDLKGLSHEIDFKNVDENSQILALTRAAAGF